MLTFKRLSNIHDKSYPIDTHPGVSDPADTHDNARAKRPY